MFTDTLLELAEKNRNIVVVTSDARGSVTLEKFVEQLPEQFVEVGIAEQDAIGVGAGLASCGKKVFVCGPACFLTGRSIEQIKIDVAYAHTNVKIVGVSGGLSYGALGASHHSLHDIALMRAIPGIIVLLPCDIYQTREMTKALVEYDGPAYVRMGRNAVPNVYEENQAPFKIGKANILMEGVDIAIIATGETVHYALDAGILLRKNGIRARVIDLHTIKPIDQETILEAANDTGHIITVEEHSIYGGLGGAVSELIVQSHSVPAKILGIPDEWPITGTSPEVFNFYGLTAENIRNVAIDMLRN
jgi:transketolase